MLRDLDRGDRMVAGAFFLTLVLALLGAAALFFYEGAIR